MAQNWDIPPASTDYINEVLETKMPDALESLRTLHSGSSEPSSTVAYMLWADTTTGFLKIRNAGNSAWITIRSLTTPAVTKVADGGFWGSLSSSTTHYVGSAPHAGTVTRLVLVNSTTTVTSAAGSKEWQFVLRKFPAAAPGSPVTLFSATVGTGTSLGGVGGGSEMIGDAAYILTPDQNASCLQDDVFELDMVEVGTPTSLTRFQAALEIQ